MQLPCRQPFDRQNYVLSRRQAKVFSQITLPILLVARKKTRIMNIFVCKSWIDLTTGICIQNTISSLKDVF